MLRAHGRGQRRAGPNALRHVEQSLAVAARTGLDRRRAVELIALVDDYVFGFVVRAHEGAIFGRASAQASASTRGSRPTSRAQLATGEFPHLRALIGRRRREAGSACRPQWPPTSGASSAACRSLLDGIELHVKG